MLLYDVRKLSLDEDLSATDSPFFVNSRYVFFFVFSAMRFAK